MNFYGNNNYSKCLQTWSWSRQNCMLKIHFNLWYGFASIYTAMNSQMHFQEGKNTSILLRKTRVHTGLNFVKLINFGHSCSPKSQSFKKSIFNSDASQQVILPQDKTNFERGYNPFFYRCSTFLFVAAFKCTYPWPEFQLEEIWYDKSSHLTCLLKLHSIRFYYVHFY